MKNITINTPFNVVLSEVKAKHNGHYWFIEGTAKFNTKINEEILEYIIFFGLLEEIKKEFKDYVSQNYECSLKYLKEESLSNIPDKPAELEYGSYRPNFDTIGITVKFYQKDLTIDEIYEKINSLKSKSM